MAVAGYKIYRDGTLIGETEGGEPNYIDFNLAPDTAYVYEIAAIEIGGTVSALSDPVNITTLPSSLPASWKQQSIGDVQIPSTVDFAPDGESLTISAGGSGLGGYQDGIHFVYLPLPESDAKITARVTSLSDHHVRAGLMIRDSFSASSAHGGIYAYGDNPRRISALRRTVSGNPIWFGGLYGNYYREVTFPIWVKVVKSEQYIAAYTSEDGVDWDYLNVDEFTFGSNGMVGFAVGAHSNEETQEVTFDNISVDLDLDILPPDSPENFQLLGSTATSLDFQWDSAQDNYAVLGYTIYRDGVEVGESFLPRFQDYHLDPGQSYTYTVEAMDVAGNVSDLSSPYVVETDAQSLPGPWENADIGPVATAGHAEFINESFAVWANGHDNHLRADAQHVVYKSLEGDGEIITRLAEYLPEDTIPHQAGIFIRESMAQNAPNVFLAWQSDDTARLIARSQTSGTNSQIGSTEATDGVWLRLVREGNSFAAYTGNDGYGWSLLSSTTVNMSSDAYIGFAVVGGEPEDLAEAVFEFSSITTDTSSSVPSEEDEGVDGLTQVEEVYGAAGTSVSGSWVSSGDSTYNISRRGTMEYSLSVPSDGLYVVEIEGRARNGEAIDQHYFDLNVSLDGVNLGRHTLVSKEADAGTVQALTPWLTSPDTVLQVTWENVAPNRRFQIDQVRLLRIDGPDSNDSGHPDWVEALNADFHGLDTGWETSRTSPAFIEGDARFPSRVSLSDETPVEEGVYRRWFANVPLSPEQATPLTVFYEKEALSDQTTLTWETTNVLNEETLTIRLGDSLLLEAHPFGAEPGDGSATVSIGEDDLTLVPGTPQPYLFDEAGTFEVQATWSGSDTIQATLTVNVVTADMGDDPVAWAARNRDWEIPYLPGEVSLEFDDRIGLVQEEALGEDSYRFSLITDAPRDRNVLARLGEDGPVVAKAVVQGLQIFGASQTGAFFIDQFPDGTYLVETHVYQTTVYPDVSVRLNIIVSGVSFEDGSGVKYLHEDDFDELGMATVRFIMPEGVQTSNCHRIRAYQNDTHLGNY
ncbi:MAG: fibronectin type III domain-containing protein [Opitutales bacterium]|nr:fibronectin type III domain-containing protein [Opitutales bacterium]